MVRSASSCWREGLVEGGKGGKREWGSGLWRCVFGRTWWWVEMGGDRKGWRVSVDVN